jgi:hypothetical protein
LPDFSWQEFSAPVGKAATGHFTDEMIGSAATGRNTKRALAQEQKDDWPAKLDVGLKRSDRAKRNPVSWLIETAAILYFHQPKSFGREHEEAARPKPGRAACIRSKRMKGERSAMAVWSESDMKRRARQN